MATTPNDQAGLKAYIADLKSQGKSESTSKSYAKAVIKLKQFTPEKFDLEAGGGNEAILQRGVEAPKEISAIQSGGGEDLSGYLDNYQKGVFEKAGSPELREQISAQLEPDVGQPDTLNRMDEGSFMREEMGVGGLETTVNDLKAQLEEQYASKRARTQAAEGDPVALGVIGGRVSEIERQETERIDAIGRQLNVVNDQLNTAYANIEMNMSFMGMDYQDAKDKYDSEFDRNLKIYNLMDEEMDEEEANARANLQTYQNAILAGNIDFNVLSGDQKLAINKMELQSKLPIGFTASLQAKGKIISTTTRDSGGQKYADVVMQMPDGSTKVQSQLLGASSSGKETTVSLQEKSSSMTSKLRGAAGTDGKVSPDTWRQGMQGWVALGGDEEDYKSRFGSYVNKSYDSWYEDYEGFSIEDAFLRT